MRWPETGFSFARAETEQEGVPGTALVYPVCLDRGLILMRTRRADAAGVVTYGNLTAIYWTTSVFAAADVLRSDDSRVSLSCESKRPDVERPYKAGIQLLPALVPCGCVGDFDCFVVLQNRDSRVESVIVLLGLPVYWLWSRQGKKNAVQRMKNLL